MALLIKTIFFKQTKIVKKTAFARNYLYKPPQPPQGAQCHYLSGSINQFLFFAYNRYTQFSVHKS